MNEALLEKLTSLPEKPESWEHKSNQTGISICNDMFLSLMNRLYHECGFDMLCAHTAFDWIDEGLFELVYVLFSSSDGNQIVVSTKVPRDNPVIPTVSDLWAVAEWQEREAYDLMGILYDNHKDLRRVFLDDDWQGFPLRKDYQDDFMLKEPPK